MDSKASNIPVAGQMGITLEALTTVIFSVRDQRTVDLAIRRADDEVVIGLYSGKTLADLQPAYGKCVLMDEDDAFRRSAEAKCEPMRFCTEDDYDSMLGALPPLKWRTDLAEGSFRMGECYSGDVYHTFVRLRQGSQWVFFRGLKRISVEHEVLVAECRLLLAAVN